MAYTSWSIRGRSYYRVFWRFPRGPPGGRGVLRYLQREGVDWEKSARQGYIRLKRDVRQIPVGTETAIVEFMVVLDEGLNPVATRVVELVHVSVYKNVDGAPDPQTNTGRGLIARQYVARRSAAVRRPRRRAVSNGQPTMRPPIVLMNSPKDWGEFGRQQSVAQTCLHCHMHDGTAQASTV